MTRIALNLYNAAGEILLHYNDDNVLVLNSFIGGCWGLEERLSGYSLNPGTKADSETTHAEISDGSLVPRPLPAFNVAHFSSVQH